MSRTSKPIFGDKVAADAALQQIRSETTAGYVPPYYFALVYAVQKRESEAVSELQRAYQEQDSTLVSLRIDPRFDNLRNNPGYQALVERMAFPAERR